MNSNPLCSFLDRKKLGYVLLIFFLIIISVAALRVRDHLQTPQNTRDDINWGLMDYQNTIYYPVSAYLEGVNPYDYELYIKNYPVDASFPVYSPLTLLIHAPFGMLSFRDSNIVYFFFNVVLMVVLAGLILHVCHLPKSLATVMFLALLMVLSRPGWIVILCGQIICEVTIGTIIALHYSREKPVLSGLGLALACLKPTFGVPLAVLMMFRRDYRAVFFGALFSFIGAMAAILLMPRTENGIVGFFSVILDQHVMSDNLLGVPDPAYHMRIDTLSVLSRLFSFSPGTLMMIIVFLFFLVVFGAVMWNVERHGRNLGASSLSSLVVSLVMLCSIYHMEYDALILFVPLLSLLFCVRNRFLEISKPLLWLGVCATLFFLFNPLTTKFAQAFLELDGDAIGVIGSIDGLAVFLALLACTFVATRGRRAEKPLEADSGALR